MKAQLLTRPVLHANETPVPMLKPGLGRTHRAYLWSYATSEYDEFITHGPRLSAQQLHRSVKRLLVVWTVRTRKFRPEIPETESRRSRQRVTIHICGPIK